MLHLQQPMKHINPQKRPRVKPLSFTDTLSLVLHAIAKSRGISAMDRQSLVPWLPWCETRNLWDGSFLWDYHYQLRNPRNPPDNNGIWGKNNDGREVYVDFH